MKRFARWPLIPGLMLSLILSFIMLRTTVFLRAPEQVEMESITLALEPMTVTMDGPLPAIEGVLITGEAFTNDTLAGKNAVITFWASWCEACQEGLVALDALNSSDLSQDLVFITVNVGEDAATAEQFLEDMGISLPVVLDTEGRLAAELGQHYFPTSYFVDRAGIIRSKAFGSLSAEDVEAQIALLETYWPGED